jgi:uncharacterized protein (TIGR02246 family)
MKISLVVVICGLIAGSVSAARADTAAQEISVASRAFSAAYVRGDTTALADLYTEDALLLPPGREVRGRANVALFFAPIPDRQNLSHAMESEELEITGAVAVDVGTWQNTWRIGKAAEQSASGRYLVVWRRGEDGRWRIAYDMWHRPAR